MYHFFYLFKIATFPGLRRATKKYQSTPRSLMEKLANCFVPLLFIINWFFFKERSKTYYFEKEFIVFEL
jgi:hypothetical protein